MIDQQFNWQLTNSPDMCDDKYARIYGGALNTSHQPTTAGQTGRRHRRRH